MRHSRPSLTARWISAHRARLDRTRPSTPEGNPAGDHALDRAVGGLLALPFGRPTGMAERTRFVDNEVAGAIGRGLDQIVLLGAGYDGRALRFVHAGIRWFEVDFPSTQEDKRRRLSALGLEAGTDAVTYLPLDLLRDDLDAALTAAGHDPTRPSLYVCEGLFPYLTLEAVADLCRTLRDRSPDGSVLAATFLVVPEEGDRSKAVRSAVDQVLRTIGERRRSEYVIGDPEKLMVVTGWRVVRSSRSAPSWLSQGCFALFLAGEPA
jgi:methyltransferase (TIGR00027 family)